MKVNWPAGDLASLRQYREPQGISRLRRIAELRKGAISQGVQVAGERSGSLYQIVVKMNIRGVVLAVTDKPAPNRRPFQS
ncbi:hypothetical protein EV561_10498 [Rhizobium sp. BK376]|nr:hypothetical protein EV561_10498 [Rhizobium sp. BK376]